MRASISLTISCSRLANSSPAVLRLSLSASRPSACAVSASMRRCSALSSSRSASANVASLCAPIPSLPVVVVTVVVVSDDPQPAATVKANIAEAENARAAADDGSAARAWTGYSAGRVDRRPPGNAEIRRREVPLAFADDPGPIPFPAGAAEDRPL